MDAVMGWIRRCGDASEGMNDIEKNFFAGVAMPGQSIIIDSQKQQF